MVADLHTDARVAVGEGHQRIDRETELHAARWSDEAGLPERVLRAGAVARGRDLEAAGQVVDRVGHCLRAVEIGRDDGRDAKLVANVAAAITERALYQHLEIRPPRRIAGITVERRGADRRAVRWRSGLDDQAKSETGA